MPCNNVASTEDSPTQGANYYKVAVSIPRLDIQSRVLPQPTGFHPRYGCWNQLLGIEGR